MFSFVFQNYNQEDGWALRETALGTSKALSDHILSKIASMIDEVSKFCVWLIICSH